MSIFRARGIFYNFSPAGENIRNASQQQESPKTKSYIWLGMWQQISQIFECTFWQKLKLRKE